VLDGRDAEELGRLAHGGRLRLASLAAAAAERRPK
jgi:hypothetical protein